MAKIQSITIPTLGIANELYLKVLPFSMDATSCSFYYEILNKDEEGKERLFLSGNLEMTETEFDGWAADNNYCLNWAANKLGLTLINN